LVRHVELPYDRSRAFRVTSAQLRPCDRPKQAATLVDDY
jgi:hypothetical protein